MGEALRRDGPRTYEALRQGVADALAAGKEWAREAVEAVRVVTYSEVGQLIHAHVLAHQDRADYGAQVIARLSADVGLSESLLYDALGLFRAFGIFHARGELGWTHYRALLRLPTQKARLAFRRAAAKNGWSVRELEERIRAASLKDAGDRSDTDKRNGKGGGAEEPFDTRLSALLRTRQGDGGAGEKRLTPKRGTLYLYRLKEQEGRPVLDAGFKEGRRLPAELAGAFQPGDTVRTVRDRAGVEGYRYERAEGRKRYYSYRATVAEIIDGDTLWASVDFGFDWVARKKLRLRDIDTPELDTEAGQRAKAHLAQVLQEAEPFVITTTKVDLYDRYLTDVFVLPGERDLQKVLDEGRFLNRELIETGYARRWTKEKPPEF